MNPLRFLPPLIALLLFGFVLVSFDKLTANAEVIGQWYSPDSETHLSITKEQVLSLRVLLIQEQAHYYSLSGTTLAIQPIGHGQAQLYYR